MYEAKKISSGVYLKFHKKINLSLDDCDKITDFIFNEYNDLLKEWIKDQFENKPYEMSISRQAEWKLLNDLRDYNAKINEHTRNKNQT